MALSESLNDLIMGLRFCRDLPFFIRRRMDSELARKTINSRIANRGKLLWDTCRRVIQGSKPYARMFNLADCNLADVKKLIDKEGPEGALLALYNNGIYLTGDEFKGHKPIVRGSTSFQARPEDFRGREATSHIPFLTGRSRGQGTVVLTGLESFWDGACESRISLDAWGQHDWVQAHWQLPGSGVLGRVIEMNMLGIPTERWFSQVDSRSRDVHWRYYLSEKALIWGSAFGGTKIPQPEYVSTQDPAPILNWVASVLFGDQTPHICTTVSSAVRLCLSAREQDIDIKGLYFTVLGEAVTPARVKVFNQAGVRFVARFSSMEAGLMGLNCHHPITSDDSHVTSDNVVLIQPGAEGAKADLPPQALLVSTLMASNPFDLINFSNGDQGELEQRDCACPLQNAGWHMHVKNIRSFEKLTGGGVTFLDHQLIKILEELLPRRFGGAPTDYQLVEDEDTNGLPLLRLLVRPSLGKLNQKEVKQAFLAVLSQGGEAQKVAADHWRDGRVVRVERKDPMMTPAGKILHLHQKLGE